MIIKTLVIGLLEVNNYLVISEKTNQAVLIDAGGDFRKQDSLRMNPEPKLSMFLIPMAILTILRETLISRISSGQKY